MTIYLLFAVICVSAPVDFSGPAVIDLTTNEAWVDADPAVSVDLEPAAGPRQKHVVWDTTHGVYLTYYPQTRYSAMLNMLTDSGYTVDIFGGGLNTIDLEQYDVIVICLGTSWYSAYGQEEVDSVYAFYGRGRQRVVLTGDMNFCENTYIVNADNVSFAYNIFDWLSSSGGGIFIMGDNTGCPNANINPVNDTFAMQSGIASLSPSDLYFSNFGAYPIFDGITQLYYRAGGSIAAAAPALEAAWTSANEPTIGLLDQSTAVREIETIGDTPLILRVNPNPFRGNATVTSASGGKIYIYDCEGRLCAVADNPRIGSGLNPGVYFIRVGDSAPFKAVKLR
jgi:hypothetical protein